MNSWGLEDQVLAGGGGQIDLKCFRASSRAYLASGAEKEIRLDAKAPPVVIEIEPF